jgi:hypothetical protein
MPTIEWLRCKSCQAEFSPEDATYQKVDTNPPDYELRCPDCNSYNLAEYHKAMCDHCGVHQVADEGDLCQECFTEYREAMAEQAKDDFFDR